MKESNEDVIHLINNPLVLFDASCLLYIHGNNPSYKRSINDHIHSTLEKLNSNRYIGFIDGKKNFRKKVAEQKIYKGNRTSMKSSLLDRFPYFYRIRDLLLEEYNMKVVNNIEADDAVSIINDRINFNKTVDFKFVDSTNTIQTKKAIRTTYKSVIATIDKDLTQGEGIYYNLKSHKMVISHQANSYLQLKDNRKDFEGKGYKFLYAQVLKGDTVDNIPGLPMCGAVKVCEKILPDCITEFDYKEAVKEAYVKEYGEEEGLIKLKEMYSLVFILKSNPNLGKIKINYV